MNGNGDVDAHGDGPPDVKVPRMDDDVEGNHCFQSYRLSRIQFIINT